MKTKPWQHLNNNQATCDLCGGISIFVPDNELISKGKHLTYWRWWSKFKEAHNHLNWKKVKYHGM